MLLMVSIISSCKITKKIQISSLTEHEIVEFYKSKNVDSFLLTKNYNSLISLSKLDLITVPNFIIFSGNNKEINYFDNKRCDEQTYEFLSIYNDELDIDYVEYGNLDLKFYLSHFKKMNDSLDEDSILKSNNLKVFMNTATYAEQKKFNSNREALNIYYEFKDKFDIYIVNFDAREEWNASINCR